MLQRPQFAMQYMHDRQGEEILLKEGKHQVMMTWEKPYMEACIDALQPFGDVLEIGFGCGFSANHIQTYFPKSHTIIECHPEVIKKASEWASYHPSAKIIEDTWQNALSLLGVFDAIFFDDYPLETEEEMNHLVAKQKESQGVSKQIKALEDQVYKKIPYLSSFLYSSQDLLIFFKEQKDMGSEKLSRFLRDLVGKGQVSASDAKFVCDSLKNEGIYIDVDTQEMVSKKTGPFNFHRKGDRLFTFLQQCLNHHMRKGSRFSCYLNDPTSKYEDKMWFDEIITNPFLDYEERRIGVDVPEHCDYYHHSEALVITITKK